MTPGSPRPERGFSDGKLGLIVADRRKQANPGVSFLRAARTDLAAAYDSLGLPEQAQRFKKELADTAVGRR